MPHHGQGPLTQHPRGQLRQERLRCDAFGLVFEGSFVEIIGLGRAVAVADEEKGDETIQTGVSGQIVAREVAIGRDGLARAGPGTSMRIIPMWPIWEQTTARIVCSARA
jgi:hypothetical protein